MSVLLLPVPRRLVVVATLRHLHRRQLCGDGSGDEEKDDGSGYNGMRIFFLRLFTSASAFLYPSTSFSRAVVETEVDKEETEAATSPTSGSGGGGLTRPSDN
ncbi:hypothetical protein E2562_010872 [Oryza meyeriana var. granulata]|uniref:Uncharacterized protein n=1 Tax=Oryza meyeriana var. granulata TaxID=110450 RepID=A0A6G1BV65_9ORYZ|nr:hypothetical protein E2562_010872 [Oryza meyeriana var. granulata]